MNNTCFILENLEIKKKAKGDKITLNTSFQGEPLTY